MSRWHPLALFLSGAILIALSACSLERPLDAIPEREAVEPLPPLLHFEAPHAGLTYTIADDVDPNLDGIQIDARVLVRDEEHEVAIEDLGLEAGEIISRLDVRESADGARRAEARLSFHSSSAVHLCASAGTGDDAIVLFDVVVDD